MPKVSFNWQDPFLLDHQLSEDERMVREAAAAYCQDKLAPRVLNAFRNEQTDATIFREMGELGLLGPTIPTEYGGPGAQQTQLAHFAKDGGIGLLVAKSIEHTWGQFVLAVRCGGFAHHALVFAELMV